MAKWNGYDSRRLAANCSGDALTTSICRASRTAPAYPLATAAMVASSGRCEKSRVRRM